MPAFTSQLSLKALRAPVAKRSSKRVCAARAEATPPPAPKLGLFDAMKPTGVLPETINGRAAQVAFLGALMAEINTGESFLTQFQTHPGAIVTAAGLVTLASFMPALNQADGYSVDPASVKNQSWPWNAETEKSNSRAAMVGLVAMIATETLLGHSVFGAKTASFEPIEFDTVAISASAPQAFEAPAPAPVLAAPAVVEAPVAAAPAVVEAAPVAAPVEAVEAFEAVEVFTPPADAEGIQTPVVEFAYEEAQEQAPVMAEEVDAAEEAEIENTEEAIFIEAFNSENAELAQ